MSSSNLLESTRVVMLDFEVLHFRGCSTTTYLNLLMESGSCPTKKVSKRSGVVYEQKIRWLFILFTTGQSYNVTLALIVVEHFWRGNPLGLRPRTSLLCKFSVKLHLNYLIKKTLAVVLCNALVVEHRINFSSK